jgi:hypothetical protein
MAEQRIYPVTNHPTSVTLLSNSVPMVGIARFSALPENAVTKDVSITVIKMAA